MEAERILNDSLPCDVHLAMPHDYVAMIEAVHFDVVMVDAGVVEHGGTDIIRYLKQSGTAVIFTTLTNDSMERVPEFKGFATVAKPFVDEDLLSAVTLALRLPELDI